MDVGRVYDVIEQSRRRDERVRRRAPGGELPARRGRLRQPVRQLSFPTRPSRMWDLLDEGRIEEAKQIQRVAHEIDHIIAEGHPRYGHQCYSKALAAAAGYPIGDVRAAAHPLRASSARKACKRRDKMVPLMNDLDTLVRAHEGKARRRNDRNAGAGPAPPALFTPFTVRAVTFRNRVVVTPMCQYIATRRPCVVAGTRASRPFLARRQSAAPSSKPARSRARAASRRTASASTS